jgi:hypothetical protein
LAVLWICNSGTPFQYVFELKYLKQSDADKLNVTMESAKKQLKSYLEKDAELQSLKRLKAIAVVAVKDKIYWEEI